MAVEAADGLSLNGFSVLPDAPPRVGIVWLHGFGVGYDLPECVALGRAVASRGLGFVSGGLRGHDGASTGWRRIGDGYEILRTGSWYEIFEESAMDVAAWLAHARSLDFSTLVLAGHSFGALRAVYYISETKRHGIGGLALVSPSFGFRHLDRGVAARAQEMCEAGRGPELLPAGSWPRGFGTDTVSAQTYASWWRVAPTFFEGARTRFAEIDCPLLVTYGSKGDVGGPAEVDLIAEQATSVPSFESKILAGAHHRYAGSEAMVAETVATWIDHHVNRAS